MKPKSPQPKPFYTEDRAQQGKNQYTSADIKFHTRHLGEIQTGFPPKTMHPREAANKVFGPLRGWISTAGSRILWIFGPAHMSAPSDVSLTSAHMVSIVNDARFSKIAYHHQQDGSPSDALIRMTYSLLLQLISLLPKEFPSDRSFHSDYFAILTAACEPYLKR